KRCLGPIQENGEIKRARTRDIFESNTPGSPSTSTASPEVCSSPVIFRPEGGGDPAGLKDDETSTVEDDITFIKSATEILNITKVKSECVESKEELGKQMERADSDSTVSMEISAAALPSNSSIGTQTHQNPIVKQEVGKSETGQYGESNRINFEPPTVESSTSKELNSINAETRPHQKNVPILEEENQEKSKTTSTLKIEEELSHGDISDESSPGYQSSAKLENSVLDVFEAQQQQDTLLELLEVAAKERDESRSQQLLLSSQVEELRSQLQEITQSTLKNEQSHHSTQTNPEEAEDYKVLYLQAKEEIKQLRDQVDSLENGNGTLLTCCESLQKELEEIKSKTEKVKVSVEDREVQTDFPNSHEENTATSAEALISGRGRDCQLQQHETRGRSENGRDNNNLQTDNSRLRDLRQRVAQLLLTFIPALDLQQAESQTESHEPVGQYGNGFKSGSMRLGKDVIVFSKKHGIMCVGLLSQTYLEMKETFSQELEFDVMKDCYDIRIPDDDVYNRTREKLKRHAKGSISVPESEYSLRAYCSILYLKPRMEIILQGQKVKTQSVIQTLTNVYIDTYKPVCDPPLEKGIKITFGFNTNTKEHYGLMMYHKNRLIKAYQRVACQRRADIKGEGVIGVMECNHLTPTHNKQDFVYSEEYRKTMLNVGKKLEQYWKNYHYAYETNFTKPETVKQPDQNRVQCNDCLKWRKLPDGIDPKRLPKVWFCHMNPDPQFRTCVAEEEPGDSADELSIYTGTPKQHKKHQQGNTRHEQSTFTSSSSIQTTPHHSGATSAGTRHSPELAVPKRKMKGLDCSYEKPEKKKARQKGLDDSDASKAECKDIKTAVKNEADKVIDKIMKEEGNQMPHFSFDDKNKCKLLYVQVLEAVRYLQDKIIELKKELKNEGVETKMDSLEYECMLSNCFESLQQDFEEIKMKSENVELSVNDCSACSTEASKPESGTWKVESGSEKGHLPSHLRLIELKKRVTHRLANLVPALKCARVRDEILSDVMNVMTPEEQVMLEKEAKFQEAHLSPVEECSTSTPLSHIGHHSAVTDVLLPEPDQRSTDRDAYRFLCSHAGQFHCKLTNLVFEMKGSGEVSYTVVPWDNSQLQGMGQFQPAGPLYNIKCSEDSVVYLHLPHCEIHTDNNRIELAVAHFSQENVEILQPLKITNTHVILHVRGLSLFGLFKKIFGGELNNAQVLLFYKENIGTQRWKKLHIHLLPGNVPVKEVQKENPGSTYLQCSSLCQLISGKKYKPLCEPYIPQPKIETFVPNFGPNYHPTFEMILNSEVEDLTLGLLDETDLEVWEPRHVILTDNAYDPDVSAKQFWIDQTVYKEQDCLIFMDNGKGMDYDKMHKMLRTPLGELEFVFKVPNDIQIPVDVYNGSREKFRRQAWGGMSVPESEYSLRAYCSILYLKPRMQIILQGQKVETQYVTKTLAKVITDTYKPVCLTSIKKAITITFGYNTKSKEHYGLMMYHKNRLIKAYERVACQRRGNNRGEGIIGVIVCNHLTPIHNKQDFEKNEEYWRTMSSVGKKLEEYWKQVLFIHDTKCNGRLEDTVEQPDRQWVQCDDCLKWRKLPDGIDAKKLPKRWLCHMNLDPKYRSCTDEEEPENSNDGQHRYRKTYKQHEQAQKFQQRHQEARQQQSTLSSIQTTSHYSGDTLADTLHSSVLKRSKRKKKALYLGYENPEKKKARRKGFDDSIPDLSTCLPRMFSDESDASNSENKDIKTALTDEGVEVMYKSMEKKNRVLTELRQRVDHLLVNFIPAVDRGQVTDDILTQFIDVISPEAEVMLTKETEIQEAHLPSGSNEGDKRSISTQPSHTRQHSADVFIPEPVKQSADSGAYRFLCSHAGQFHCKLTNLIFEMKGSGEVTYTIMPWDNSQLQGMGQFKPAGPLYNIKCSEESILNLHIPHCEIATDNYQIELAVAHFGEDNVEILQPLKIKNTHVILKFQGLSIFGLLKKSMFVEKPISAQVLLFYKEIMENQQKATLHIHLLPGNVPVEEVQKQHQGSTYLQCSSICQLTPGKKYRPLCEPHVSQSKVVAFGCDFGPYCHPTFEVTLNTEVEDLTLGLLDETGQEVWEPRQVSPRFLHSNSTSHTWPFSAIAELIDNAYDPDVSAKQFWIDKAKIKDQDCLTFTDNGKGMDYEKMHKMLSDKQILRGHAPVGLYGNGFKSGSMRLGKDAIVFSKKDNTITVVEHAESLHEILAHSLFDNEEELLSEFGVIKSSGTRIIIWNLVRRSPKEFEFDFIKDDIRIPVDVYKGSREECRRKAWGDMPVPESEYSLREYCSILYLKPRMEIILQGLKVEMQSVTENLKNVYEYTHKPACLKKEIIVTFGHNKKSKEHYGLMMYHKNRLIKAYEHVPCQRRANGTGAEVIGVIECNYLTPIHNKQDFDNTEEYRNTMIGVGKKLEKYSNEFCYLHKQKTKWSEPFEDTVEQDLKLPQENSQQSTGTFMSSTSSDSSADSQDTSSLITHKRKSLDLGYENPVQKKARGKGKVDNIANLSIYLPHMSGHASDANKAECKDIKIPLKDEGDGAIDRSIVKKEESNQMLHFGCDDKKNYKLLYVQVLEAIGNLQYKLIEFRKELNKEGVNTMIGSLEYKGMLSDCYESLGKDLEEIKTKSENVELSVKDAAISTEAFKQEGKDSTLQIWKDETVDRSSKIKELKQRVAGLLATFVPVLDCERVTKEILTQVIDMICTTEIKGAVYNEKEEYLSLEEDECSISTQPPHTKHVSAVTDVLLPESVQYSADSGAYSFLCSHAGQFHCKLTNLVFEMKRSGKVLYTFVSWDKSQLQGMGQFQPAGPLYNITCSEDSILYLHLPHCEINTENNLIELAVAHVTSDDNVEIFQPLKITNTHVIFEVPGLSIFGLLKKWIFCEKPISAQVLLFYKENIGTQRRRKLHIHLLPGNVPVKEVQKQHQGNTYIQCSSICQLIPGKKYKPLCEPYVSQPKVETFGCDIGPNFHPTFEVILNTEVEVLTLGLLDETGQEVWEPRHVILTADNREAIASEIVEDNAYDPDVNAKQLWINKTSVKDQDCLIFMDNGEGMDYDKMLRMLSPTPRHAECLRDILKHSLFNTVEELLAEFSVIDSLCGTRIIIWNLRRTSSGKLEFDLKTDYYDIRIPLDVYEDTREANKRQHEGEMSLPESEYSLRAYCSILYLKPRMQIIIQGQKVEAQFVTKSLAKVFKDTYKPACLKKGMTITFGYNTKSKEHYGIMMYNKNRLIKAYEHVACQRK
ncbi:MORC family CW-type zinc finger protein 3, partial [Clarias magur]